MNARKVRTLPPTVVAPPEARIVVAGTPATFECQGGWIRQPVTTDGVLLETDHTTVFIPKSRILEWAKKLKETK